MINCTFLRINDRIYNANCIKYITILNNQPLQCHILTKIIVVFNDDMDISPMHFWTYWPEIGQIFYDWSHNKGNLFEIPYLTDEEARKIDKDWNDNLNKEINRNV
jgi:hypothetical protein